MEFGERLKLLRADKGVTQTDVADILNVGRATIAGYETKGKQPDHDKLIKLSDYFNVSIDYLLSGKSNTRNPEQPKDPAPIADVEEAMKIILDQPGLMLKGDILSDESKIILANSILNGIKLAEELERHKKGDNND